MKTTYISIHDIKEIYISKQQNIAGTYSIKMKFFPSDDKASSDEIILFNDKKIKITKEK